MKKYIAHLDLDCFFVSVERIHDASLVGKPVVVGGYGRRGVVASASYEARKYGVHSAMPTGRALQLCPGLIVVRGRHGEYGRISKRLYARLCEVAPLVEQTSIDEMYMDFTGCEKLYGNDLPGFMKRLQAMVREEFSLPCTIALASNKVIAKIGSGFAKPAGVLFVKHGTEKEFLAPLPVGVIPGVGAKTEKELKKYNFTHIRDIQQTSLEIVETLLGEHGRYIYNTAMGLGSDTLEVEWKRKSISNEETFGTDIADVGELERRLFELTESVCHTTRRYGWKGKTVKLKLRYSDFTTVTRHSTLREPTNDDRTVFDEVRRIFGKAYDRRQAVRLLGVGLSQFIPSMEETPSLFGSDERRQNALTAVDALKKKFGDETIHTGSA